MKVTSDLLKLMHLDKKHSLLTSRDVLILKRVFDLMDLRSMILLHSNPLPSIHPSNHAVAATTRMLAGCRR